MAAIVCQGLQSRLESKLIESRALTLNFPFSKPHTPQQPIDLPFKTSLWDSNPQTHCEKLHNKTDTTTGWSFVQVLSNVSHGIKEPTEKENAYVPPQAKKSSVLLNQKSLELCTEKLGNETGSDIVENIDDGIEELLCSSPTREQQTGPRHVLGGRRTRTQNFPPPLTTIRGSESLRVRSHREDGRLVIEAFRVPPSDSCFRAERSNGRLRLCFLKNTNFDSEDEEKEPTNDNEGVEDECDCESDENEEIKEVGEGEVEEGTEEEGEDGEREDACECDGEMRIEKYERPRRCNEGGDHENNEMLINRGKPLWVAIS